ncbi:NTP pyrophosphohydrolase [Saccharothrix sp. S26]|uniref:NTP pyrophosphohydrolase n=1 Tax=Saccharothrix sp. S26 TaxID=2907215 RepID=UPI001F45878B|nr:NTP pyrophosphohydrolase [Saccharothrix sp. S26]MCE6995601.1 NTP pyrophosphohydrolase [Saccharothrix sp. S26]
MTHPLLVVDAANVVGSVPDGWWRDRAGAAARLRDDLVAVAEHGLPDLPGPLEVVLVVEGRARHVESVPGVRVVSALASGDDAIVDVVRANPPDRPCTVITADRALRDRVTTLNATVLGPRTIRRSR